MAKTKRKVCRSKSTGKIVSCKRQRAGKKAARKRGTSGGVGKGPCKKWAKKKGNKKRRCLKRGK